MPESSVGWKKRSFTIYNRSHPEPGGAQGAVRGLGEIREGDVSHAQLLRRQVLHLRHTQLRQRHRADVPHQPVNPPDQIRKTSCDHY